MINLDTRILDKTSPDGLYLLCRITAYMNANRFCFPSNKSLAKATGFSESKVNRVKKELMEQGLLSCEFRFREDKSQTSSIYKIKTGLISVFVRGDEMSELTPPLITDDTPPVFTDDTPPLSLVTTREVLEDLSIIHLEVLKGDVEPSSTPFLDDEEMQSLEEKILASKLNQDPTPQLRATPRPKGKRETTAEEMDLVFQVVQYLNEKTEQSFQPGGEKTKLLILARHHGDKWSLEDFKTVIDHKKSEWFSKDNLRQYLRPSTLFAAGHAEEYLQAAKLWKKKPVATSPGVVPLYRQENYQNVDKSKFKF